MAVVNKAQIEISAVDKTKRALNSITGGLGKVTGALLSMKGAIAGAVGVGGFGALIKASLTAGDQLAKTSDKLGITTEALVGLRHAAEMTAGVTGKTLDTALQRMTRRVSEAAVGTGAAVKALDELGLSAAAMARQSPDQQFRQIADAMQGVASQGECRHRSCRPIRQSIRLRKPRPRWQVVAVHLCLRSPDNSSKRFSPKDALTVSTSFQHVFLCELLIFVPFEVRGRPSSGALRRTYLVICGIPFCGAARLTIGGT